MNLTHIRYFIEAAKCENFTKASSNLYIAQPNLSKHIAVLEKDIGVKLFFRENRTVKLTPAGELFYRQLKDVPNLIDSAVDQAQALGRAGSGKISVGILDGQNLNEIMLRRIDGFSADHPNVELHMERDGFRQLRRGLESGFYDLIVTLSFEADSMDNIETAVIFQQLGTIAINKKNPKAWDRDLSLDQLKDENFVVISPEESPRGYEVFLEQCAKFGFVPSICYLSRSTEGTLLCVEAGRGVALLDQNTRLEGSNEVRIVTIPSSDPNNLIAVWSKAGKNEFVSTLAGYLSKQSQTCDKGAVTGL